MDLAKVGEVYECMGIAEANQKLREGWVLLTVKISDHRATTYVLGKPREKPKPEDRPRSLGPHDCFDQAD